MLRIKRRGWYTAFMKTRTAVAVFMLLALFALIQAGMRGSKNSRVYDIAEIVVNNRTASVLLADTELKRIRGLSGKDSIGADGMLFISPNEDSLGIWMKEMQFPIDIIWLADADERGLQSAQMVADGRISVNQRRHQRESAVLMVVDMKENVAPETFPEVFYPKERAQYVLETNAGFTRDTAVSVGDRISVRFNEMTRR